MLNDAVNLEIIENLKRIDKDRLTTALTGALTSGYTLPPTINHLICFLQEDYKLNRDPKVFALIYERIKEHFHVIFQWLTAPTFLESQWGDGFLIFLVQKLNITLEKDSLSVEAFIKNAKIHWRIIKTLTREPVYARHHWFEDATAPRLLMTWERFQEFKNAGKRNGTVQLTQNLFVAQFNFYLQTVAVSVWLELHAKGILTAKNRLSESWRIVSNVTIFLNTVSNYDTSINYIFVLMKNFLAQGIRPAKDSFVEHSIPFYRPHACLIWEKYASNGFHLTDTAIKMIMKEDEFRLDYTTICNAIYAVINDPRNQEILPNVTAVTLFRPERTIKKWENTGRVVHSHQDGTETQLLDVAVYSDAQTHKLAPEYRELKVERDHLPSFGIFHLYAEHFFNIHQFNLFIASVLNEERYGGKHGAYWWTIAIPNLLHVQGATHGKKINQQLAELGNNNAFLRDISTYLTFIENSPEKAATTFFIRSYLKFLGAFRHLYHRQVKAHAPLDTKNYVGFTPHLFFHHRNENQLIDTFFSDKVSNHLKHHPHK